MEAAEPITVSVVIPHYNTRPYVRAAVESVLTQTVAVHEVIVIDDGSPDDPADVLSAVTDPRLKVVRTPNAGAPHARNVGFALTTGEIVAFLDADDTWYSTKLERQLPVFEEACAPVVVGSQMHHVGSRGSPVGTTGEQEMGDEAQRLVRSGELMPFPISSALITRTAFQAMGGFDDTVNLVEDLDLMSRLAAYGAIRTVDEPLGAYLMRSGSGSARHFREQRQKTRFVRARISARAAGGDLTWAEFVQTRRPSRREWVKDTGQSLYRAAGVLAAEGHYVRASWRLGLSAVLRPSYALPRLKRQRVFTHLRRSLTPASRR